MSTTFDSNTQKYSGQVDISSQQPTNVNIIATIVVGKEAQGYSTLMSTWGIYNNSIVVNSHMQGNRCATVYWLYTN